MMTSVFGGSQPKDGSKPYAEAVELGRSLARLGHTVLTGGYLGTMEAVSRGAAEAGGHVIGVTCAEIERWRRIRVNSWVSQEWKRETLIERLQTLIEACDVALALPGGPGTLTEISLTWNLMIVGAVGRKPLILIGDAWRSVFAELFLRLGDYIPQDQRVLLQFASDSNSALETLKNMR
jgi:hypothetical protein